MHWIFIVILGAVCVAFFLHILRLRRLLRELDDAVRSQRRLLPEDSSATLQRIGALDLVDSLNGLIDSHQDLKTQRKGQSSQVEALLGAVQEAVIVFDGERIIEYANRSAEVLFRDGKSMKGLRLEAAFRSLSLLAILKEATEVERIESRQIQVEQESEKLWFEASCARVRPVGPVATRSTLLVLHDITKLKALEVMRREFVANVSHELRTPLTIIKGFAETLIDDADMIKPEARLRFTKKILNNAERLHVLVEDLLTLSRLESRPDQIEPLDQPLAPLVEEIAENYRSRIKGGDQAIVVTIDDTLSTLQYDRYRIHQVFDNFVENVFRYAPDFTKLELETVVLKDEGMVRCSVVDDGPGIPEKDLPHLFERFYRVDKGRSRDTGGTGLGLSIVKHIVQLHGGRVEASSQIGKGTRMSFYLPLEPSGVSPELTKASD